MLIYPFFVSFLYSFSFFFVGCNAITVSIILNYFLLAGHQFIVWYLNILCIIILFNRGQISNLSICFFQILYIIDEATRLIDKCSSFPGLLLIGQKKYYLQKCIAITFYSVIHVIVFYRKVTPREGIAVLFKDVRTDPG